MTTHEIKDELSSEDIESISHQLIVRFAKSGFNSADTLTIITMMLGEVAASNYCDKYEEIIDYTAKGAKKLADIFLKAIENGELNMKSAGDESKH